MRNGFFGISDEESRPAEKTAAQRLLEGHQFAVWIQRRALAIDFAVRQRCANGSFMRSFLHIDMRDLSFKDGPNGTHDCVFDVLAMTFGDNGVQVDYTGQTFTLDLPDAEYQRAMQQGLVYNITVPVKKPGAYQFRMALRDTSPTGPVPSTNLSRCLTWEASVWPFRASVLSGKSIAAGGANSNSPAGGIPALILKPVRRCAILNR